jgi:hypothetical protein
MSAPSIDTHGLIRLIEALEGRCECEYGRRRTECRENPLDRSWRRALVEESTLRERVLAVDARRTA